MTKLKLKTKQVCENVARVQKKDDKNTCWYKKKKSKRSDINGCKNATSKG